MSDFATEGNPNSEHVEDKVPTPRQEYVKTRKANRDPNSFKGDSKSDYERFDKMDQETIGRLGKLEGTEANE